MSGHEIILLRRDCEALLIPSGASIHLPRGTEVTITQSLGGSYTVSVYGNLARINGVNADALGKEVVVSLQGEEANQDAETLIWQQMKTCYDPEIPVNIVDLGLIYECQIEENDNAQKQVSIKMTLTAPGCGMGPTLAADVKQKVLAVPSVVDVNVDVVFDPPWDQSRMSEVAKLQLGLL